MKLGCLANLFADLRKAPQPLASITLRRLLNAQEGRMPLLMLRAGSLRACICICFSFMDPDSGAKERAVEEPSTQSVPQLMATGTASIQAEQVPKTTRPQAPQAAQVQDVDLVFQLLGEMRCRVSLALAFTAGMHIGCAGSGDRYMFRARLLAEDAPPEDAEQLWADSMEALSSQGLCAGVLTDRDRNISNSTSRLLTLGAIAARVPLLTLLLRFEASNRAEMELAQPIPTELRRAPIPVKACSRAERRRRAAGCDWPGSQLAPQTALVKAGKRRILWEHQRSTRAPKGKGLAANLQDQDPGNKLAAEMQLDTRHRLKGAAAAAYISLQLYRGWPSRPRCTGPSTPEFGAPALQPARFIEPNASMQTKSNLWESWLPFLAISFHAQTWCGAKFKPLITMENALPKDPVTACNALTCRDSFAPGPTCFNGALPRFNSTRDSRPDPLCSGKHGQPQRSSPGHYKEVSFSNDGLALAHELCFLFCFNPKDAKTSSAPPFRHCFRSLPRFEALARFESLHVVPSACPSAANKANTRKDVLYDTAAGPRAEGKRRKQRRYREAEAVCTYIQSKPALISGKRCYEYLASRSFGELATLQLEEAQEPIFGALAEAAELSRLWAAGEWQVFERCSIMCDKEGAHGFNDVLRRIGQWAFGNPSKTRAGPRTQTFTYALSLTSACIASIAVCVKAHMASTMCCTKHAQITSL
ncbi:hypothetical protein AK812_SmicGene29104 [Symbiodinium microadriaticum]|uniref:Uncharacterized protein n=1 Tax=Symbiodinium microadriaticum TaxID=2951 RepID=A0A1Q9D2N5_SYMMI|nr:hypothetical protein AK812_SmicGene29104 [Symbiodinium microadriaticum]